MINRDKVTPSSQVDSLVPGYIYDNYSEFVTFMEKAAESEERIGFGQDILQNLSKYRDLDTYKDKIVEFGLLNKTIDADDVELQLVDATGFPEENGVLLIDDEVILYTSREGNDLYGLQRGASGTTVLPTLRASSTYLKTTADAHLKGSRVTNLSVIFMVAILDKIHKSYTPNIDTTRVGENINRSSLIQNIRDFFASKGSKLGIRALFRMLFEVDDVEVTYPGDRMIKASESTYAEDFILRAIPVPKTLTNPSAVYLLPDEALGSRLELKNYNTGEVLAQVYSDYASTYPLNDTIQYEYHLDKNNIRGNLRSNPFTKLTRTLNVFGTSNDNVDVTTITVETTLGFPDSGIVFINGEGIKYTNKTGSQFQGCTRGHVSVEREHPVGSTVWGPYLLEASFTKDGVLHQSRSFPMGLVGDIEIRNYGLLQNPTDTITPGDAGKTDPRNVILTSLVENHTDELVTQASSTNLPFVGNNTHGINAIYFDDRFVYVSSTNLPSYDMEDFSTDGSIGPLLKGERAIHVIPQRSEIRENTENIKKGSDIIGITVDGIPLYSDISKEKQVYGKILRFKVNKGGRGYNNPTVLVDGGAQASVTLKDGQVTSVDLLFSPDYTVQPNVAIVGGIGGTISLSFDNYGRITDASIVNPGQYYTTAPSITIDDETGRGRGALITTEVSGGRLVSLDIKNPGIDYSANNTTAVVVANGSGAEVVAICEEYTFDEYARIRQNPATDLDSNNGFLFKDVDNNHSKFGFLGNPNYLRTTLGDDGTAHSPIIGWAVDGNPIYGPYAYTNGRDASGGVQEQVSGYILPRDRSNVIPSNSDVVAGAPPSTQAFSMGTFIEDYIYDVTEAALTGGNINTEDLDDITTEGGDYIRYMRTVAGVLDENNGKVCNTPEFPYELYPDGVYCYFATAFGSLASFPYNVGPVFHNRPQSQNVRLLNNGEVITTDKPESAYDNTEVTIDFSQANRFRTAYLSPTKQGVSASFTGTSSGSISSIGIEDGVVANIAVGDKLHFNESGTDGTGAQAIVTAVAPDVNVIVPTIATSAPAGGFDIQTRIFSHRQRIDLKLATDVQSNYTFRTNSVVTSNSGASGEVVSYDATNKILILKVTTAKLFKYGDFFFDNKGRKATMPVDAAANEGIFDSEIVGGVSTHISYSQPESEDAEPGDLWWDSQQGGLFVYYNDGDTSQWVQATPNGGFTSGATSTSTHFGPGGSLASSVLTSHDGTRVSISNIAPSRRTDGSANQLGDLWWSTHTGMLYIWGGDESNAYSGGEYNWTSEWICTDPIGMVSMEGATNDYEYATSSSGGGTVYEQSTRVLISDSSPTTMDDGGALTAGVLWWSPINGKMFIYYADGDSSQWVIVNPTGTLSGEFGLDYIPSTDSTGQALSILPETTDQRDIWVETLDHFEVGDSATILTGAPGSGGEENVTVNQIFSNRKAFITRNPVFSERIQPNHGATLKNTSRYLYRIVCDSQINVREGLEIEVTSPVNPEMNGKYDIVSVGNVIAATATATISGGEVTGVTIISGGSNYVSSHYVQFVGGGGVGAYGYANVVDGSVESITMIEGGVNYTSVPAVIFDNTNNDNTFLIYTDKKYLADPNLEFNTTDGSTFTNTAAAELNLISGGLGYTSLPVVNGIVHRDIDNASLRPTLSGSTIDDVLILKGGSRYSNPVIVIEDLAGNGSGATATATITNGAISGITITDAGSGYTEPVAYAYEPGGVFSLNTTDIGKINSVSVTGLGRNISPDRSLAPELQLDVKIVFTRINGSGYSFLVGDTVYQGHVDTKLAEGIVKSYDGARQLLVIEQVIGKFNVGEVIHGTSGNAGMVTTVGQADLHVQVKSAAALDGRYIDDTSKIGTDYSVIQDSLKYQWFSYNIASPLQQEQFEPFVKQTVHPAGFVMFSDVLISDTISTPSDSKDVVILGSPAP